MLTRLRVHRFGDPLLLGYFCRIGFIGQNADDDPIRNS